MRWYILACIGVLLLGALTVRAWVMPPETVIVQAPTPTLSALPVAQEPTHIVIDPPEPQQRTFGEVFHGPRH